MGDEAALVAQLLDLHEQHHRVNLRLGVLDHRKRAEPAQATQIDREQQAAVRELDRLMNRMRAVEGQLLVLRKRSENS